MITLHCTKKLLARQPGPAGDAADGFSSVLGDWHANIIWLARSPFILFANNQTLLSFLLPGKNVSQILPLFRHRVLERLVEIGVSPSDIERERAAITVIRVAPTNNRSVLGSLNDMAQHCKWKVEDDGELNIPNIERYLMEMPFQAIKFYFPIETALKLF